MRFWLYLIYCRLGRLEKKIDFMYRMLVDELNEEEDSGSRIDNLRNQLRRSRRKLQKAVGKEPTT